MTKMQQRIYDYLVVCIQEQGYPPTVREIGDAVGLRSPSTVHFHLKHLEEAGTIQMGGGKGRAITLTDPPMKKDRIPVLGNVAAGAPILAQEHIEEYLPFDAGGHPEEYFALRVRGESMLKAGILPEDLVVVHQQPQVENAEICVALLGEEATVKRFSNKNGRIFLLPENDEYTPIDGKEAVILGKVTAVFRRY